MTTPQDVIAGTARWCVVEGEALEVLAPMRELSAIPDASVDALITDAPYSSGGQFRGDRMAAPSGKYQGDEERGLYEEFAGDNRDQRSFLFWCTLWLSQTARVLKPGAPVCLFTDWRQLPTTTDVVQAAGFVWRGIVPWDKTEACRPIPGRFRAQAEYVVWGSNGPMPLTRNASVLPGVISERVDAGEKYHMTGKPVPLMRKINAICEPGGVILDPFGGSASTGVAGLMDGYRVILVERTSHYAQLARERMEAAERGLTLREARAQQARLF